MKKIRIFLTISIFAPLIGCSQSQDPSGNELKIIAQPQSTITTLGSPTSFEVKVNDESLVKSYQWQLLNIEQQEEPFNSLSNNSDNLGAQYWVDIKCQSATTNKLIIPGPSFALQRPYRCIITDTKGNAITSDECFYTLKDYQENDPFIAVGTRVVAAGQTLDLTSTPFGSGIISLNDKGDTLTLNNVNFSNQVFDYDPFDSDVSLYFYCYKYMNGNFTIKLIGENIINNTYYEEENKAGGITLGMFFSGRGIMPEVLIDGDGSLTTFGGSHAIYCNSNLTIRSNITLHGITNHWNSGIHASKIIIDEGVRINADLTSYLFEANSKGNPILGCIDISNNAVIEARITPVQDGTHGSALSALSVFASSHDINISNSTINVDLVYDSINLEDGNLLPPSTIFSTNNSGNLNIVRDSKVYINMTSLSEDEDMFGMIVNTTSVAGQFKISDSIFSVIGNLPHVQSVYGPLANDIYAENSDIYVNLVGGIVNCFASHTSMYISNVNMNIVGHCLNQEDGFSYGVVANGKLKEGTLKIENSCRIHVKLNTGIAFGTLIGKGSEERQYDPSYTPSGLILDDSKILLPTGGKVNVISLQSKVTQYQYFETIFNVSSQPNIALEVYYNS